LYWKLELVLHQIFVLNCVCICLCISVFVCVCARARACVCVLLCLNMSLYSCVCLCHFTFVFVYVTLFLYLCDALLVPYRFTGGDFRFTLRPSVRLSVCPSVCLTVSPSVRKTGSRDNLKSTKNIFYETWYMDRWQYGDYARLFLFILCWKFWLLWQQIVWKYGKFNT
jgi:hypothetical protein